MQVSFLITKTQECSESWNIASDIQESFQFKSHKRQQTYLRGRSAIRQLLFIETSEKNWEISVHQNGKPYIHNGPHISLSHSGDIVACAMCEEAPIGIDVEHWKPRDFNAIAAFSFNAEQQEEVRQNGIEAFYKYWTAKEAIVKINGSSIFQPDIQMDNYTIYYQHIENNYSLAIAAEAISGTTMEAVRKGH